MPSSYDNKAQLGQPGLLARTTIMLWRFDSNLDLRSDWHANWTQEPECVRTLIDAHELTRAWVRAASQPTFLPPPPANLWGRASALFGLSCLTLPLQNPAPARPGRSTMQAGPCWPSGLSPGWPCLPMCLIHITLHCSTPGPLTLWCNLLQSLELG